MDRQNYDIIVVGGGIVGLAVAYKIGLHSPEAAVLVLEKEESVALHQTGHNSGVIHSGLYYNPGSRKARTCVEGRTELIEFAQTHGIPYEICGKIVVATSEAEIPALQRLYENGTATGVEGLEMIDAGRIREIEPNCRGIAGLWVPGTGIINFRRVSQKLAELISARTGSAVQTGQRVLDFHRSDAQIEVITQSDKFVAAQVIVCGGLQGDRLAARSRSEIGLQIVGFRGDYYELTEQAREKVRNLIYPVPDPQFPFLGVHFTRMIDGGGRVRTECGFQFQT